MNKYLGRTAEELARYYSQINIRTVIETACRDYLGKIETDSSTFVQVGTNEKKKKYLPINFFCFVLKRLYLKTLWGILKIMFYFIFNISMMWFWILKIFWTGR